ncbi:predicted protein [Naegleria gruberi]|uniref:Predicted protein n=1 Tax=Naegleria gruberi TaxID=5762 RepID=D2V6P5_NAEGR|nr:uncharacterized protein NAEGRDRAFT_64514 [Naegleria gruberi]EFC47615.1 predicted protein [Naegleria gruberi]|eukprot:XP_002680359.1 predicted protein [Naegleria gruberi strain NEG-M]
MRKQRENDIQHFMDSSKLVQAKHTLMMGEELHDDIELKNVKFDSVESFQKAKNEIPSVDISEGLEQIEQAKAIQDIKIDILLGQIQQVGGIANSFSDDLDKQAQLLYDMSSQVDKYNNHLD